MSQGVVRRAREGEVDYHTIDRYTFAHAGAGFLMGILRAPWWLAVGAAVAWEFAERPLKQAYPDMFHAPTQDTPENSTADAAAWVMGWAYGHRLTDDYPLQPAKPYEP